MLMLWRVKLNLVLSFILSTVRSISVQAAKFIGGSSSDAVLGIDGWKEKTGTDDRWENEFLNGDHDSVNVV